MTYIDRHKIFGHLDRLAAWQKGDRPAPVTVEWDLSNRCALGCMDCHFAHTHTRGPWTSKPRALPMAFDNGGDLADMTLVKRALLEMAAAGVLGIIWSGGGEPTTHPAWRAAVRYARDCGLEQGMYTLGGLLSQDGACELATTAKWVVVSLDAPDAGTYASEKGVPPARFFAACQGISWLAEARSAAVGVSFLLHEGNWARCNEMLQLARGLDATYATFRPAIRTSPDDPTRCLGDRGWITEARPYLEQLASERDVELDVDRFLQYRDWSGRSYSTCYGVRLTATVTPDGRVWVCPQRRGCSGSSIGDLRTESFRELWNRHTGEWTDFSGCRAMCRLHLMNETLATVFAKREHEAFV